MVLRSVTPNRESWNRDIKCKWRKLKYNERARSIMKEVKSQGGIVRSENTAKSQSKQKPSRAVKKGE